MRTKTRATTKLLGALTILALTASPALAQHKHEEGEEHAPKEAGEKHHEGGHDSKAMIPESPDDIVAELLSRFVLIEHHIEEGTLTKVHEPAFEAKELSDALTARADLSASDMKKLRTAGKRIGSAAKLLDQYGDAMDAAKTKTAFKTFNDGIQAIRGLYPKAVPSHYWTCSMKQDADVWKAAAGKCPKCGMKLIEKGEAPHGEDEEHGHSEKDEHAH